MRSTYGVALDWPITYDDLEPWYVVAENAIGVAGDSDEVNGSPRSAPYPMPAHPLSYNDTVYAEAVEPLGLRVTATPQARVSIQEGYNKRPRCCANAFCIPMCPIGAKYDATVHLDMAVAAGAEVRENCVVFKLAHDSDGQITSLSYRNPDKQDTTLTARHIVVAAHAIETPKPLLMSRSDAMPNGLANSSDQVGCNLMDHPTQLTYGLAPEPVGPYRAPLSTGGIEMLRDGEFRRERGAYRIELDNDGWSWPGKNPVSWAGDLIQRGLEGRELYRQVMELNARALRTAALVEQLPDPDSRVALSDEVDAIGIPRPEVHCIIDEYAKAGLAAARDQFTAIYEAVGADQVTQVQAIQGAGHIIGTHRMGSDSRASVTDSCDRTWDHPNLWLAGSGLFPTGGTANPTLTIAALALRTAPEVLKALREAA